MHRTHRLACGALSLLPLPGQLGFTTLLGSPDARCRLSATKIASGQGPYGPTHSCPKAMGAMPESPGRHALGGGGRRQVCSPPMGPAKETPWEHLPAGLRLPGASSSGGHSQLAPFSEAFGSARKTGLVGSGCREKLPHAVHLYAAGCLSTGLSILQERATGPPKYRESSRVHRHSGRGALGMQMSPYSS